MAATKPAETTSNRKQNRPRKQKEKELAQLLYMQTDLSMGQIADKVAVSMKTLSKWADEGQWLILRSAATATRTNQIRYHLLQLDELNRQISEREPGKRYPTIQESDIISKVTKAVEILNKKEATLSDYVSVFEQWVIFLKSAGQQSLLHQAEGMIHQFITMKAESLR